MRICRLWPYIVPAPYHAMYGTGDIQPVQRDDRELDNPHPVLAADHILEGQSLLPLVHGNCPKNWRQVVISEYDYSATPRAAALGVCPRDARMFMVFDGRWQRIHFEGGFRPMLFDLQRDPDEFVDLGDDPAYAGEIAVMYEHLATWRRRMSQRVTMSDADIYANRGRSARKGILPFLVDGSEVPDALTEKYRGPVRQDYTPD